MRRKTLAERRRAPVCLVLVLAVIGTSSACSAADPAADVADPASDELAAALASGATRLTVETPIGPVALVGATLVDVTDESRDIDDAVVLMSGDRIVAAGPRGEIELPADVQEIDVTGRWIVPGLIDAFATLNDQTYADAYLAMGVTGIVGVGGGRRGELWLNADPGPRVFPLEGVGSEPMESVAAVEAAVDELAANGVHVALLMYGLDVEQLEAAISRARQLGMATIGELGRSTYAEGERLGLDAFVHTTRYSLDIAPREMAAAVAAEPFSNELDSPKWGYYLWLARSDPNGTSATDHAEVLGGGTAFLIPTLSLLYLDYEQHANPWDFPVAAWLDPEKINAPADPQTGDHTYDDAHMAAYAEIAAQVLELESRYRAAGASYLAGSATDVWGTMPGISLHTEMEMLTRIGLSPREVLAAASANVAKALHLDGLGTVVAGSYADLVVVGNDPTLDLTTLQRPELVVSAGRLVRWEDQ